MPQNIARLGVVLGLDTSEFTKNIDAAIAENQKLARTIKSQSNSAAGEIVALSRATQDYGKEVSRATLIQREFTAGGKYANATQQLKDELLKAAKAYDAVSLSANKASISQTTGLKAHQQAALSYQATDIVTQLAGGQNPLLVAIQQGGQLKDQFGGFLPLFSAIKSVVFSAAGAIGLLAAGIGGAGYAAYLGSKEFKEFSNSMTLTGHYAGVTYDQFSALANQLSSRLNVSLSSSKQALQSLAASGQFTATQLEPLGTVILKMAELSGQSSEVVAQKLIPSLNGTASGAKTLNDSMHFLTLEQYKHIEALEKQHKKTEAITYVINALANSLPDTTKNLGFLESAWNAVGNAITRAIEALKSWGRDKTAQEQLDALSKSIDYTQQKIDNATQDSVKERYQKLLDAKVKAFKEYALQISQEVAGVQEKSQVAQKSTGEINKYASTSQANSKREQTFKEEIARERADFSGRTEKLERSSDQIKRQKELIGLTELEIKIKQAGWKLDDENANYQIELRKKIVEEAAKEFPNKEKIKLLEEEGVAYDALTEKIKERNAQLERGIYIAQQDEANKKAQLPILYDTQRGIESIKMATDLAAEGNEAWMSTAVKGFELLGRHNKAAFMAAKAFNIANAIMNTYLGATKALATYPPPWNFAAAALVVAAGLAQVASIRSQQFQGREFGGTVNKGQPYVVGEKGKEVFIPNENGFIVNNTNTMNSGMMSDNNKRLSNDNDINIMLSVDSNSKNSSFKNSKENKVEITINAVDSKSVYELLSQNPQLMYGLFKKGEEQVGSESFR